jgi:hypothetical protein
MSIMGIWGLLGKGEIVSRAAEDFYPIVRRSLVALLFSLRA